MSELRIETEIIHRDQCPWCGSSDFHTLFKTPDRSGSGELFPVCQCNRCALVFTQDVPAPERIASYYQFQEYISHSNTTESFTDKVYHRVRNIMLQRKFRIVQKHKLTGGQSILDYGTGTGYFLHMMQSKGWETQGVEIDPGARKHAVEQFGLDVKSPDNLHTLENQYDVITLWHVLEHLYDFKDKVQFFHEKLKSKGLLIMALPNHFSLDAQVLKRDWAAFDTPRHLWHFNPKLIKSMASKFGFEYVRSHKMPFDAFYVSILSYQIKQNNWWALIKGGMLGLLSNIYSIFKPEKSSSLIYILRKK